MGREPLSRIEKILSNIVGEGSYELDPSLSDAEEILIAILNDETIDIDARDRFCTILLCILNGEEYTGVTMSRAEEILKCISEGEKYEVDEWTYENHLSRVEQLLTDWANAEDPEYSKTVSGVIIHVLDAVEKPAESLVVTMEPKQEATPFIDATTKEPYLLKTASTTGNKRYLDKIVGGTVCWNQLVDIENPTFINDAYVTYDATTHRYTVTYPENSSSASYILRFSLNMVEGHKYFYRQTIVAKSENFNMRFQFPWMNSVYTYSNSSSSMPPCFGNGTIFQRASGNYESTNIGKGSVVTFAQSMTFEYQMVDLTQLFSNAPAIADYVYSLEQATTGAGVSWLKDHGFIDDLYRAFNAGELISAKPTAFTVGSNTYALGGVDLRGLFKLDAQNNLYCDGDELTPDGVVTAKFEEINLGDYTYSETVMSNNRKLFSTSYLNFPETPYYNKATPTPSICPIGIVTYQQASAWRVGEYVFAKNSSIIPESEALGFIVDATKYADATAFKNAVSGIHLAYLTATPTTSSQTPYQNPVDISNGDTESFTDTRAVPIPCGNESHYAGKYEIEGTTGVTVTRTGFNQWDEVWETGMLDDVTGQNKTANNRIRSKNYIPITNGITYYFNTAGMNMFAFFFDEGKNLIPNVGDGTNYSRKNNSTFTIPNNAKWMRFYSTSAYGGTYNNDICINIHGDKDGTYESYVDSTTYTVTFTEQGTVYGGVIDIVTGVLTITWGYIASYNGETLTGRWISSLDAYAEGTTPTTGAEVAYELASPITAELTPQEVQMLLGENYFWAENGESMELTYLGSNPAMMMQAMRAQNNILKKQGLPTIALKPKDPIIIKDPIVTPIKPKL